jgi:cytochrome c oxidase subunit I
VTFLIQHVLGVQGMPRRYADYPAQFATLNLVSSLGSFLLGLSTLVFFYNVLLSARRARPVLPDDPWGYANSLEWATSSPPPRHNFTEIPRIRSFRPAFDLHYPADGDPPPAERPSIRPG